MVLTSAFFIATLMLACSLNLSLWLIKSNMVRYSLSDWLYLHNLNVCDVRSLFLNLDANWDAHSKIQNNNFSTSLDAKQSWILTSKALTKKLPPLTNEISKVAKFCKLDFLADQNEKPFTALEEGNEFPKVSMSFNGSAADILCVAHEFGHALQYYLASGQFIPPIYRELAAFTAEVMFLEYIEDHHSGLSKSLQNAWSGDNQIYLIDNVKKLLVALKAPEKSDYLYLYNYPLARIAAENIKKNSISDELLSTFFYGNPEKIQGLLNEFKLFGESYMINYLPEIPEPDQQYPAINAYRSLGMMALLDIDYWQGESEKNIDEYYSSRLSHMQSQTALVAVGKEKKPIGYVTWEKGPNESNIIYLKRQAAPFGNHLELQKKLQNIIPENTKVLSHHSRSAREEQVAW